ncbi:hypothetical protein SSOG_07556 [Streptomyces himastatinicus ATCC 53653]|uniref:WXG100 family type VII secretion target n=1 Tax=Streptomyces himastatinicus ATCC 53653 TaxID=457427 RepID=D9WMH6_9ACTN|nr:hypothetical protein [Streptomyces himastatinicus]EFL27842.1 hypothetical protein SSOG_07556 [Streptomyces himastatinicus ATCC 53653]
MGSGSGGGRVLDIKVADIKSVSPTFHHQAVKLSEALTTLINTLDGYGGPWGDDKPGKDFAKHYKPNQKHIESATGVLVLGLTSIHEAMQDMADGHVDNDKLIEGMFTKAKNAPGKDGHK